ncbi:MAG: GFA family protein [Caulobacteraceae bacterium]|nr:GFA family protein [Caulobacteraceae bacterium]
MVQEGGCLCGAVRFACEGEPINVRVCHCRLCQKAFGAPFNARALFAQDRVTFSGPVGRHPSSPAIDRLFCRTCGSRLASWRSNGSAVGVALALFDDRDALAPTEHIWVSEKLDWLVLADGLPQHPEAAPA